MPNKIVFTVCMCVKFIYRKVISIQENLSESKNIPEPFIKISTNIILFYFIPYTC